MSPAPPPKQTSEQMISSLTWKLNNLETKVRINEQNIMNDRRHVQLLNRSILDLKKSVRDRIDKILNESGPDLEKRIGDLELKIEKLESNLKKFVKRSEISTMQKFHENFNYFDKEMSKEEADNILDDIVKKSEG